MYVSSFILSQVRMKMGENDDSYMMMVMITIVITFVSLIWWFVATRGGGRSKGKLPPGGRGWPVVGDSISWYNAVASSHPPAFVHKQVRRYGPIFSCSLFGKWAVASADPAFNKFVMQNEGKLFQSNYPKSFRDLVGKNGVITAQGDHQRKLHSIASNMMRLDKLRFHFLQDIQIVIGQIFTNLHHNQVVPLQDVCRKLAINLMVNQLLGVSSESQVNHIAQLFSHFVDGCLSLPINLPGFAYHKAMKARENIISKINTTIETHKRNSSRDIGNGVLGRLLKEESLPDDAVADFIINLLFAGNETTAKTMLFAVYFLTQCPRSMKQMLDEHQSLRSERGEEEMLTWQDYKAMPFTQCVSPLLIIYHYDLTPLATIYILGTQPLIFLQVIDETLRLGGIAIWLMREAKEQVEYKDYVIPKGSFVVPFLSAVHLDENVYEDPRSFNPWRWMEPENQVIHLRGFTNFLMLRDKYKSLIYYSVHNINKIQEKRNWRSSPYFAPFGGGARFCPGAELARLQIALFLHYFLTTFRWRQVKDDNMSFFPSARLVNGFQIQLNRISHDHHVSTSIN
ncbi:abietadienol/abietadienal oxidase-like isoform X2 [Salvia splendens]|uniref:abietadienol/abietadienal oxidase-like isoform X2 n=1 Tax=Salvia splendens TaxID=180675 RepID=UPI001C26D82D|nr:abietadienol/abietadienal oxidase-like isoform X2 [Salvia splendens]